MAEAIAAIEDGKRVGPRRKLEEALRLDPRHVEARAAMLRLSAGAIADGADPEQILPPPLSDEERALADGWAARARDPRALAAGRARGPARSGSAAPSARLRRRAAARAGAARERRSCAGQGSRSARQRASRRSLRPQLDPAARGDRCGRGRSRRRAGDALRAARRARPAAGLESARSSSARAIWPARRPPTIRSCPGCAPATLRRLGVAVPRGAPRNAGCRRSALAEPRPEHKAGPPEERPGWIELEDLG